MMFFAFCLKLIKYDVFLIRTFVSYVPYFLRALRVFIFFRTLRVLRTFIFYAPNVPWFFMYLHFFTLIFLRVLSAFIFSNKIWKPK